jgi:hypothetical protein
MFLSVPGPHTGANPSFTYTVIYVWKKFEPPAALSRLSGSGARCSGSARLPLWCASSASFGGVLLSATIASCGSKVVTSSLEISSFWPLRPRERLSTFLHRGVRPLERLSTSPTLVLVKPISRVSCIGEGRRLVRSTPLEASRSMVTSTSASWEVGRLSFYT